MRDHFENSPKFVSHLLPEKFHFPFIQFLLILNECFPSNLAYSSETDFISVSFRPNSLQNSKINWNLKSTKMKPNLMRNRKSLIK